jgi:hypothetical protein
VLRQADGDDGGLASSPTDWMQMSAEGQTWNIRKYCCMLRRDPYGSTPIYASRKDAKTQRKDKNRNSHKKAQKTQKQTADKHECTQILDGPDQAASASKE